MALTNRTTRTDDGIVADERGERTGPVPGLIRALFTLAGVAIAGFLIWLASTFDLDSNGEWWTAIGLIAAAGLVLGLSQLFGGWTKWGWPTLSPGMLLFAFLPTLIVGGWILLAKQPQSGPQEGRFDRWSGDLGISGFVNDLATFLPVIPLVIGLVLAFSFDTTGPRTRIVRREPGIPDEDVQDYRRPVGTTPTTTTTGESSVAEDLRSRDDRTEVVSTGARDDRIGRDERVEIRDPERRDTTP